MAKQDEKQRLRRRLQDQAVEYASISRWEESVETNKQILTLGEDAETFNRIGKGYLELGQYTAARDAYQNALRFNPTNSIARKNLARLETWFANGSADVAETARSRQQVDMRLFITETGKTALTTLADVPRSSTVAALVTGEKMDLRVEERTVDVVDTEGNVIGRIEPKLGQRLAELMTGGNRYVAAIAQNDPRHVRLLLRETYQDPSQRGRISFPGKLSEGMVRSYAPALRYDYESDEMEDDDIIEERDETEEEYTGSDEEELGLDEIEPDINDDDDGNEE